MPIFFSEYQKSLCRLLFDWEFYFNKFNTFIFLSSIVRRLFAE